MAKCKKCKKEHPKNYEGTVKGWFYRNLIGPALGSPLSDKLFGDWSDAYTVWDPRFKKPDCWPDNDN